MAHCELGQGESFPFNQLLHLCMPWVLLSVNSLLSVFTSPIVTFVITIFSSRPYSFSQRGNFQCTMHIHKCKGNCVVAQNNTHLCVKICWWILDMCLLEHCVSLRIVIAVLSDILTVTILPPPFIIWDTKNTFHIVILHYVGIYNVGIS